MPSVAQAGRPGGHAPQAPPAVAPPPGNPRFAHLDGMRAIAFFTVLAEHASTASGFAQRPNVGVAFEELKFGVPVFFMLSAFLLLRPFVNTVVTGARRVGVVRFYWRRFLRIMPLYWLALVVVGLLPALAEVDPSYREIFSVDAPLFFGLLQVYSDNTVHDGLVQAWSLADEAMFYLLLPLLAAAGAAVWRRRGTYASIVALIVALGLGSWLLRLYLGHVSPRPLGYRWFDVTLFTTFAWFAFGLWLAIVTVPGSTRRGAPRLLLWLGRHPAVSWSLAALAYVGVCQHLSDQHIGILFIGALLLIPAVLDEGGAGRIRRFLRSRIVAWLGLVSYSLYLWHLPILQLLCLTSLRDSFLLLSVATLALTIPVSAATYYLIEAPLLRLKDWSPAWPRLKPRVSD